MPGRRRGGKKIDFTFWAGATDTKQTVSAGISAATLFAAEATPKTLMRMRGSLICYIDSTSAPPLMIEVGVGICVVPEGTGSTVLWSPLIDRDVPWVWSADFIIGYEEMVTDVIDIPGLTSYREVIDNKAMRILRNQDLQIVWENVTVGGAASFNGAVAIRALFGR